MILRMINRLFKPTEGRMVLGSEDVTEIDGGELRRRIERIERIDELLELVFVDWLGGIVEEVVRPKGL
jgi:osmoprotectant transport system ATP-binding protein